MNDNYKKYIGNFGENEAVKFLKKNKYKVVATNYSCKHGEIDIICENKEFIVFVEVKTRKKDALTSGVYAVDKRKQAHIIKTAHTYLRENCSDKQPRFDIIEVEIDYATNTVVEINHIADAYIQGGSYAAF